jgi:hypothetical protein
LKVEICFDVEYVDFRQMISALQTKRSISAGKSLWDHALAELPDGRDGHAATLILKLPTTPGSQR